MNSDNKKIFENYANSLDEARGGSEPGGGMLGNIGQKIKGLVPGRTGLAAKNELKEREEIQRTRADTLSCYRALDGIGDSTS